MVKTKLGHHLICEATGCNRTLLDSEIDMVNIILKACAKGGCGILGHISHKFEPQGVTVVVGLSESHCSVHTWPELGYAMLDVCTCGDHVNPRVIFDSIKDELGGQIVVREIERGLPEEK